MTDSLTIATHFEEISGLADGFVDRVDGERLMLYGPHSYEEGTELTFEVQFVDGSAALQGAGRVIASIDGGEERDPEARYDVVLDQLRLEPRAEAFYERILMARETAQGGRPATGEIATDEIEEIEEQAAEQAAEPQALEPSASDAETVDEDEVDWEVEGPDEVTRPAMEAATDMPDMGESDLDQDEEPTAVVDASYAAAYAAAAAGSEEDEAPSLEPPPELQAVPEPELTEDHASEAAMEADIPEASASVPPPPGVLSRPVRRAGWRPNDVPPPQPRASGGVFMYGDDGLPAPPTPPRPDLDISLRVTPAPHPNAQAKPDLKPSAPSKPPSDAEEEWVDAQSAVTEIDDEMQEQPTD